MNKILFCLFLLLSSFSLLAEDFCARNQDDIRGILQDPNQRIAFKNDGGLFNGGVCWWHSRLQRAASYLVRYNASQPRPNPAQVKNILNSLRHMNQVVVIPGYSNFLSFTKNNQKATQKMLEEWQRYDGIMNAEWRRGISGKYSLPPAELEKQMQTVFEFFKNSPVPVWIMAQLKGISSHAFLIVDMVQQGNGFDLLIIDSNLPNKTRVLPYRYGQSSLRVTGSTYNFVPYVGFQNDFRLISASIRASCPHLSPKVLDEFSNVQDGQIERAR